MDITNIEYSTSAWFLPSKKRAEARHHGSYHLRRYRSEESQDSPGKKFTHPTEKHKTLGILIELDHLGSVRSK
jgi:hypothetical protein